MGSFGSRATIGGTTRTTRQSRGQKSISEGSEGTIDDSELGPSTSSTFTDDTPPSSIDVGDADSRVGTPEVYTPFGGIGATVSKFGIGSKSDRTSYGTGSNNGVHSQIIGHSPPLPLGIFRSALSSTAMLPIAGDVGPLSLTGAFPPHVGSSQPAARNGANIAPDSDKDPLNSAEGNVEQLQRAILTEQSNKRAQVTEEEDYPPNEQFAILDNSLNRLRATKSLKRRSSIRARGSTVIPMAIRTDVTGNTRGTDIEGTAKGILAALKSGGHKHGDSTLTAVSTPTSRRRSTARLRSSSSEWLTHLADNSNLPRLTELRDESEEITDLNVNSK